VDDDIMDDMQGLAAHNQRRQQNQNIEGLRAELERERSGVAPCPHCGGGLPQIGVSVCKHCRNDLIWYKTVVGKPGQQKACRATYQRLLAEAAVRKKKQEKVGKIVLPFVLVTFVLIVWYLVALIKGLPSL
jgi:hypothetical protein